MPKPLNCFDVDSTHVTCLVRVLSEAGLKKPREFGVEANVLRAHLIELGRKNLLIEIETPEVLNPEQIRGLVFLLREARQRGGICAFCGGGAALQQSLGKFGMSKPADWFPTQATALAAIEGIPAMPVLPAVRPPGPAAGPIARPVFASPVPAPVSAPRPVRPAPISPPRDRVLPAHELTLRAHHRQPILDLPLVCAHLAARIRAESDQYDFSVWAFVFMPDHFHLLVHSTRLSNDTAGYLEAIKKSFQEQAIEILSVHAPQMLGRLRSQQGGRIVHDLWQRTSGQNRNVDFSRPLRPRIEYLHENPVRRGLAASPLEWKWSSAGSYAGQPLSELRHDPVPSELLGD